MAARTKARKRALDLLFEAEMQDVELATTLARRLATADPPLNEYAVALVEGIIAHRDRIDELLSTYAVGWTLDRMPAVDRNVLRIGAYEVLYRDDVPDAVAISEAVNLARDLSTDQSPGFVNGLLGRIAEIKPTLSA
jgi:transcription antitermination protein NusB